MDTKAIMRADYLDIIFDKRNKNYGGYELRKHYNLRVTRAFGVILLALVALVSFSFINIHDKPVVKVKPVIRPVDIFHIEKPPVVPPKPVEPIAEATASPVKTFKLTPPVITSDPVRPDELLPENKKIVDAVPGTTNIYSDTAGIASIPGKIPGTGVITEPVTKSDVPVKWVQQMPVFSGDMNEYLTKHLVYPELAREGHIEGRVLIQFVVNEDGGISNATVVRSAGGGLDEEALRVVRGMPKWKPGKQNGIPVKVYFTIPIVFVLS